MSGRPSIFMESVASRHDMFPGHKITAQPDINIGGIPGLQGPEGAIAMMFMEPILKGMFGAGFVPGQFRQTYNLYDHYRRKAQYQEMQSVVSNAAASDREQYVRMLRGMAATAGIRWTDERERAARMMASDMTSISPLLAQIMPDTFDAMHGTRGSAILMAQRMFEGGRFRIDPVTRMLGMSVDSTSQITREIYDRLYGPGADLVDMRGLGAGRAGQIFDEMSRRGLMPRVMSREEQLRGIARRDLQARGLFGQRLEEEMGGVLDELRNLSSPQLEMRIRQFEASRIADRIKNMAGAVAAMRDVFGEMGRPDAPMNELIEGLQVLTQGGLATTTPDRIEALVRDAANIARRTGMGMDNLTMIMATAAQKADAMGLDRTFGVTAGLQSAAFGSAYANIIGGAPAWGRGDKERMMAIDAQLRLNAANSAVGNQLAATVRLAQDVGFQAGSEAEAMYRAIQAGQTTYEFGGQRKSVYAQPGEWRAIMAASGVDMALASSYRADTAYNKRFIDENNLVGLTRQLQADIDVAPRIRQAFQRGARQVGVADQVLLARLGEAAQRGLLSDIAPEDLQNPERVAEYLAEKLGIDKTDDVKMRQLRLIAVRGWSNIEQMVQTNPRMRGYRTADQFITAHRRDATRETINQIEEAQQESRLQSALAGLGSGNPLARLIDAVSEATPETQLRDIISRTLGWVPEGEVGRRLEATVQQMRAEIAKFRDTDPERVHREAQEIDRNRRDRAERIRDLELMVKDLESGLTPEDVQREVNELTEQLRRESEEGVAALAELDRLAAQVGASREALLAGGWGPREARERARALLARQAELLQAAQPAAEELERIQAESKGLIRISRDEETQEIQIAAQDGANPEMRRRAEELAEQLRQKERQVAEADLQVYSLAARFTGGSVNALIGEAVPEDIQREARQKRDEILESRRRMQDAEAVIRQIAREKYGDDSEESVRRVMTGAGLTDPQLERLQKAAKAYNAHFERSKGHVERLQTLIQVHGFGSATFLYGDPDQATRNLAQGIQRQIEQAQRDNKPEEVQRLMQQLQTMANEQTGGDIDVLLGRKTAFEAFTGGRQVPPEVRRQVEALRDRALQARDRAVVAQNRLAALVDEHGAIDPNVLEERKAELRLVQEDLANELKAMQTDQARLQQLADRYTGGDVQALLESKDLRRKIREEAINKIRSMSPELRRQAEQAGIELGAAATSEEAVRAWTSFRDKRGAAGVAESDALAEKMLYDDRSMSVLGEDGLQVIQRIQERNRQLRELASRHAGGDIGALMASDEQRKRAQEALAQVILGAAQSRQLEDQIQEAEDQDDIEEANRLRAVLEQVNRQVIAAQTRLNDVGREVGTTGEALAHAPGIEDRTRREVAALLEGQMTDLQSVQGRLRAGRWSDITPEQRRAIEQERAMRQRTDVQVIDDVFRTLGLDRDVSEDDRQTIARDVMRGDRGLAIRSAVTALQELRQLKSDMSHEQFQDYLRSGLREDATAREKELYHFVAAGRAGGGLAGIGRDNITNLGQVTERLRDFAAWQRDTQIRNEAAARTLAQPEAVSPVQRIEGELRVNLETGSGRLVAQTRGGAR